MFMPEFPESMKPEDLVRCFVIGELDPPGMSVALDSIKDLAAGKISPVRPYTKQQAGIAAAAHVSGRAQIELSSCATF